MNKQVIETFRDVGSFDMHQMEQNEPSCFNGMVRVERYRLTVEKIDEPMEVVQARIRKLWGEVTNPHHREPLLRASKKFGIDLYETTNV